jgi:hypothetical protein|tara:strand:- start:1514 stop:1756 length:243 start_codon:yes stop_codon:yes gene_type:complete
VIKIWFLLVMMSMPNAPSIKYTGSIYPTEDDCIQGQLGLLNAYEAKPQDYKNKMVLDAFCLPFDAFPVQGMNYKDSSFGA